MSSLRKLVKFGIVGVCATLIHVVIATTMIESQIQSPVPLANLVAFLVATSFSYVGNTKWSFSEQFNRSNGIRFAITASVGCVLAVALSSLAEMLGFHYLIGFCLIVLCIPILTFLSHFFWTYQARE